MNDFLVYVIYPITVAALLGAFAMIYNLFAGLIERLHEHGSTLQHHHYRLAAIEHHTGIHCHDLEHLATGLKPPGQ